jgi:hypothetical protein
MADSVVEQFGSGLHAIIWSQRVAYEAEGYLGRQRRRNVADS